METIEYLRKLPKGIDTGLIAINCGSDLAGEREIVSLRHNSTHRYSRFLFQPEALLRAYTNYRGTPYLQYILSAKGKKRLISIKATLGLEDFKGNIYDFLALVNVVSMVKWDVDKARFFCQYKYDEIMSSTDLTYFQAAMSYITGEYIIYQTNYRESQRFKELESYGIPIMLAIYLAKFYDVIDMKEAAPFTEQVINVSTKPHHLFHYLSTLPPTDYEKYIVGFMTQQKSHFLAKIGMVPCSLFFPDSDDQPSLELLREESEIDYFLRSITQYSDVIAGNAPTDLQILEDKIITTYYSHKQLIELARPKATSTPTILMVCMNLGTMILNELSFKLFSQLHLDIGKMDIDYIGYDRMKIGSNLYSIDNKSLYPSASTISLLPSNQYDYILYEHCPYKVWENKGEILSKLHKRILKVDGKILKVGNPPERKEKFVITHHKVLDRFDHIRSIVCVPD